MKVFFENFNIVKFFIFSYFGFLFVSLFQLFTEYNCLVVLTYIYLIMLLLGSIPFYEITPETENRITDTILLGLVFVISCFCYQQTGELKQKAVNNQIYEMYNLLKKFNVLLESKSPLCNSNNVDYNPILNNLVGFIVFAGVCFFLYYMFSGGDGDGGGGRDPKDPTSYSSNTVSRSNSTDSLASTSLDTESVNVLNIDETVSNIIGNSVVKQWIDFEKKFPLSENKEDLNFFKEKSKIVIDALANENSLEASSPLDLVRNSLDDFKDVVFSLTSKLDKFGYKNDVASFKELEAIAGDLVNLLEAQSNSGTFLYENTPVLCSVAFFYGLLYESQFVVERFEDVFQSMCKPYKTYLETLSLESRNTLNNYRLQLGVWSIEAFLKELKKLADLQPFVFFKTINFKESSIVKFFKLSELNSFFK